jgi:predicted nucleic acid-binding protein
MWIGCATVKNKPIVYLDSCCFIDAVKEAVGSLPADRVDDVWHIKKLLEAHRAGIISIVTSTLSIAECVAVESGQVDVSREIQDHFRRLLTSGQYVFLAQQTPKTSRIIQELRWQSQIVLAGADALHVATALEVGACEFISTDDRIRKQKMQAAAAKLALRHIRLIRAAETRCIPDNLRQGDILNA